MIRLKRIYEAPQKDDGYRVLIDRLWPRGLSKKAARIDLWLRDIAPSDTLRKWFAHDSRRWSAFRKRYLLELKEHREQIARIKRLETKEGALTLLFVARDPRRNNAVVLYSMLAK